VRKLLRVLGCRPLALQLTVRDELVAEVVHLASKTVALVGSVMSKECNI
jgi:hypothetical protein